MNLNRFNFSIIKHSRRVSLQGICCRLAAALLILLIIAGCAKKIPHTLVPEYEKRNIRLIAVLPVADKTGHADVSQLLRGRIVEALYFKGYPKIPLNIIDEKLGAFFKNAKAPTIENLPPRDVGGILGVDAVLYTTLKDCRTSFVYLYAPTSVVADFELYNAKTGELMWRTGHQANEKNFDITPTRLKMKACQVYEPALQQIVNKVAETLPDGPDA